MSGLGSVAESNSTFLTIAGGFIWNRKAEKEDPDYAEQKYIKADKSEGVRCGARYASLSGRITAVEFKTHKEYGENINVTVSTGDNNYTLSVSVNNRYSQDLMKALLNMDTEKDIFIKPYDFIDQDRRRVQGISFKQDGEKLDLKVEGVPTKDADWFKAADKKSIKRFFEDLSDWFVAEVQQLVCPKLENSTNGSYDESEPEEEASSTEIKTKAESKVKTEAKTETSNPANETVVKTATPLAMKKALRAYIADNYEGEVLPELSKEELVIWYNLCLQEEELPFSSTSEAEVSKDDIDSQLNALMG